MLKLLVRTLSGSVATQSFRQYCIKSCIVPANNRCFTNIRNFQTLNHEPDDDLADPNKIKSFMKDGGTINMPSLAYKIKLLFGCTYEKALEMLKAHKNMRHLSISSLSEKVEHLFKEGVSSNCILNNPWILSINYRSLQNKIDILKKMNPRDINDMIPLISNPNQQLLKIQRVFRRESHIFKGSNRFYFFCDELNLEPHTVAKFFSSRQFMFEISSEMLIANIKTFKEFNVAGINILRDLWAFKYTPLSIRNRLERAKSGHKEKIMPWMVRCPEEILHRSIQLTAESRALLKDDETVIDYLSERLGYSVEYTTAIAKKHPAVFKVRVTKIKEILDYLLDEAGFEPYEIGMAPRIFCHSVETTRARIEELAKLGCRPSSLVIVCLSQREYTKFINKWLDNKPKTK